MQQDGGRSQSQRPQERGHSSVVSAKAQVVVEVVFLFYSLLHARNWQRVNHDIFLAVTVTEKICRCALKVPFSCLLSRLDLTATFLTELVCFWCCRPDERLMLRTGNGWN